MAERLYAPVDESSTRRQRDNVDGVLTLLKLLGHAFNASRYSAAENGTAGLVARIFPSAGRAEQLCSLRKETDQELRLSWMKQQLLIG